MLFLWSHTWFCELLSSQNLRRLLHTSSATLLQDQTRGGGSLGNVREQSLAQVELSPNAFLVFFHNYQQVVQGNEVEGFSLWKLFSRQGQAGAAGKKAKSRQSKHPAGTEASLAPHVPGGFLSSPPHPLVSALQWGAGLVAGTDTKKTSGKDKLPKMTAGVWYFSGACDRGTCLSSVSKGLKRM